MNFTFVGCSINVVVRQHSKKLGIVIMNEHITQGGNDSNISGIILVQMKCGQGYIDRGIRNMR
jgi:hypothetical protein